MDFNFSEEQTQLADVIKRFIANEYGFEARKNILQSPSGESEKIWEGLVDLGLHSLPIPEKFGGLGGTAVDMLVVMQEFGRGLLGGPLFATLWGTEFIKRAGNPQQKSLLEKLCLGKVKLAVALGEKQGRFELFNVETKVTPNGTSHGTSNDQNFILSGKKSVVLAGASADFLIVSARVAGASRDKSGLTLFLIPADSKGIVRHDYHTIDGYRAADFTFNQVTVPREQQLGEAGAAWKVIEETSDYAVAMLCAEAVGAMEALFNQTVEYCKTRKQFSQPIGKFQVLQHRMVDMFIHLEQARSLTYLAVAQLDSVDKAEQHRTISAAKVRVGQAAKFIGRQAVQLHGGMGVTDELPVSHYFKRLTMIELTLGDIDHHLIRFINQGSQGEITENLQ